MNGEDEGFPAAAAAAVEYATYIVRPVEPLCVDAAFQKLGDVYTHESVYESA
jgi:hypothetical protein